MPAEEREAAEDREVKDRKGWSKSKRRKMRRDAARIKVKAKADSADWFLTLAKEAKDSGHEESNIQIALGELKQEQQAADQKRAALAEVMRKKKKERDAAKKEARKERLKKKTKKNKLALQKEAEAKQRALKEPKEKKQKQPGQGARKREAERRAREAGNTQDSQSDAKKQKTAEKETKADEGYDADGTKHTLYITGLPYQVTVEEISAHFGKSCVKHHGGTQSAVLSCRLLFDKDSGKSRGICFLDVQGKAALAQGLALNNTGFQGRSMVVRQALEKAGLQQRAEVGEKKKKALREELGLTIAPKRKKRKQQGK